MVVSVSINNIILYFHPIFSTFNNNNNNIFFLELLLLFFRLLKILLLSFEVYIDIIDSSKNITEPQIYA